jgi:hypothetical protein
MLRFASDEFSLNYVTSISVWFKSRMLAMGEEIIKAQIWDSGMSRELCSPALVDLMLDSR